MDEDTTLLLVLVVGGLVLWKTGVLGRLGIGPVSADMAGAPTSRPVAAAQKPPLANQLGQMACVVGGAYYGGPAGVALGGMVAPLCGSAVEAVSKAPKSIASTIAGWF